MDFVLCGHKKSVLELMLLILFGVFIKAIHKDIKFLVRQKLKFKIKIHHSTITLHEYKYWFGGVVRYHWGFDEDNYKHIIDSVDIFKNNQYKEHIDKITLYNNVKRIYKNR